MKVQVYVEDQPPSVHSNLLLFTHIHNQLKKKTSGLELINRHTRTSTWLKYCVWPGLQWVYCWSIIASHSQHFNITEKETFISQWVIAQGCSRILFIYFNVLCTSTMIIMERNVYQTELFKIKQDLRWGSLLAIHNLYYCVNIYGMTLYMYKTII